MGAKSGGGDEGRLCAREPAHCFQANGTKRGRGEVGIGYWGFGVLGFSGLLGFYDFDSIKFPDLKEKGFWGFGFLGFYDFDFIRFPDLKDQGFWFIRVLGFWGFGVEDGFVEG